jgi:Spy/CpxP family protein refolding chaperone
MNERGRTMRGRWIGTVGVAVLWLGGSVVLAQPFGPGREGPPNGPPLGRAARALELTGQQQEAARQIFEQRRPQMEALHKQMRENHELVQEELESGHADPTAVGELVIAGHALREEDRALREESKAALESILTPEQQLRLEALEAVREGMGPRGPHRAPGAHPRAGGPPEGGPEEE